MKTRVVMTMIGLMLGMAGTARAQDSAWYAGIGAGKLDATYRPYYTYYRGGTPDQFENKADGLQVELFAGRQLRRTDDGWSLAVEANASFSSFKWSLSIPEEPSSLEYSLPYRIGLRLVPEIRFGLLSVYADVGGGAGRVHELKTTSVSTVSRYDYDRVRPTFSFGGGLKFKASNSFDVFAHVGQTRYFGVAYDSFSPTTGNLPFESKVEHVTDKPRATGFTFGIVKRF